MPNHIKNRLKIIGTNEQIKEVFFKYNTHVEAEINKAHDNSLICKNKLESGFSFGWFNVHTGIFRTREENSERIGMPEGWCFEIKKAVDLFPDFDKIIPHPRCDEYNDLPNQVIASKSKNWWMTWNRANWGTKWGGYSYESTEFGTYKFETAWNGVLKLMLELSRQNSEVKFEYAYADEDSGYNTGKFTLSEGKIIEAFEPKGGTKESYDIYFELNPCEKSNYKIVDGNYEYIDLN